MQINIALITLGCDKNTVDSESIRGILSSDSCFIWTKETQNADIILINTCCFIDDAKEQSIETILSAVAQKKPSQKIIVLGCLAQRYAKELKIEIPEIDGIIGNDQVESISKLIKQIFKGEDSTAIINPKFFEREKFYPRKRIEQGYHSYLKIAEGCDNHCSYCIIPFIKGSYRSKLPGEIIKEAKFLVENGAKEIVLIAQDIACYGKDIKPQFNLAKLLKELVKINDLKWIRLLYCHPDHMTQELIYTIAEEDKICNYLDLPIQHLSDRITKKMGRTSYQKDIYSLVAKIKDIIPDIAIRSTLIVGFPGETDNDFEILKQGLRDLGLTWCGFFKYSKEENTIAASLSDQVPEDIKIERLQSLMDIQQKITKEELLKTKGKVLPVLIEEKHFSGDAYCLGRSYLHAPEVDGQMLVKISNNNMLGKILPVHVVGVSEYDLIGEVISESSQ